MSFKNIRVIVCEEISICGKTFLVMMDKRFLQSLPDNQDESFGGIFLYLCGDMFSFCCSRTCLIYPREHSVHGRRMFESVKKVFLLKTVMCQIGLEQEQFCNCVDKYREWFRV